MKIAGTEVQVGDHVQLKVTGYAPRMRVYVMQLGPEPGTAMFQRERDSGWEKKKPGWSAWFRLPSHLWDEDREVESIEVLDTAWDAGYHPAADIFPMMLEDDFGRLVIDIEENGLIEPIVTLDEMILDGRNRLNACRVAHVEPRFVEFDGDDPLAYVMSKNENRRHLTTTERLMIWTNPLVVERERALAKARKMRARARSGPVKSQRSKLTGDVRDILADAADVGHGLIEKAIKLRKMAETDPKAARAVSNMEAGVWDHKDVFRHFLPRTTVPKTGGQIVDAAVEKAVRATRTPNLKLPKSRRYEARLDTMIKLANELGRDGKKPEDPADPPTAADRMKLQTLRLALDVWAGPAESGGTKGRKNAAL